MVGRHHQLNEQESEQTPRERKDREAWHAAVPADAKSWKWLTEQKIWIKFKYVLNIHLDKYKISDRNSVRYLVATCVVEA